MRLLDKKFNFNLMTDIDLLTTRLYSNIFGFLVLNIPINYRPERNIFTVIRNIENYIR